MLVPKDRDILIENWTRLKNTNLEIIRDFEVLFALASIAQRSRTCANTLSVADRNWSKSQTSLPFQTRPETRLCQKKHDLRSQ